jgi:hypothetical protein
MSKLRHVKARRASRMGGSRSKRYRRIEFQVNNDDFILSFLLYFVVYNYLIY